MRKLCSITMTMLACSYLLLMSSGAAASDDVHVPASTRNAHPRLVEMILASESINNRERQEWIDMLPKMDKQQLSELRRIFEKERKQLDAINEKYSRRRDADDIVRTLQSLMHSNESSRLLEGKFPVPNNRRHVTDPIFLSQEVDKYADYVLGIQFGQMPGSSKQHLLDSLPSLSRPERIRVKAALSNDQTALRGMIQFLKKSEEAQIQPAAELSRAEEELTELVGDTGEATMRNALKDENEQGSQADEIVAKIAGALLQAGSEKLIKHYANKDEYRRHRSRFPGWYCIVDSVRISQRKDNGDKWDSGDGSPDIKVMTATCTYDIEDTSIAHDTYEATFNERTTRVIEGDLLIIVVDDEDFLDNDTVESGMLFITRDLLTRGYARLSSGKIENLALRFRKE